MNKEWNNCNWDGREGIEEALSYILGARDGREVTDSFVINPSLMQDVICLTLPSTPIFEHKLDVFWIFEIGFQNKEYKFQENHKYKENVSKFLVVFVSWLLKMCF